MMFDSSSHPVSDVLINGTVTRKDFYGFGDANPHLIIIIYRPFLIVVIVTFFVWC